MGIVLPTFPSSQESLRVGRIRRASEAEQYLETYLPSGNKVTLSAGQTKLLLHDLANLAQGERLILVHLRNVWSGQIPVFPQLSWNKATEQVSVLCQVQYNSPHLQREQLDDTAWTPPEYE